MKLNRRQAKLRDTFERLEAFLVQEITVKAVGSPATDREREARRAADVLNEVFILEARRKLACWALSSLPIGAADLIEMVFDVAAAHAELQKIRAEIDDASIDPLGDVCGARRFLSEASRGWQKFNLRIVHDGVPANNGGRS